MDLTVAEQFYLLKKIHLQKKEEFTFYQKDGYDVFSATYN